VGTFTLLAFVQDLLLGQAFGALRSKWLTEPANISASWSAIWRTWLTTASRNSRSCDTTIRVPV
jgi:hypothetical protein